jgi:GTPase SAR1 family protein
LTDENNEGKYLVVVGAKGVGKSSLFHYFLFSRAKDINGVKRLPGVIYIIIEGSGTLSIINIFCSALSISPEYGDNSLHFLASLNSWFKPPPRVDLEQWIERVGVEAQLYKNEHKKEIIIIIDDVNKLAKVENGKEIIGQLKQAATTWAVSVEFGIVTLTAYLL